jgi:hypothetical protein
VSKDHATARRLLRRFMPGSGPLKRASDRIQILARVLLVALVLAAVPLARAIVYSVPTFLGSSAPAVLGYLGVRRMLDRSRMRRWAADWAVVEPVWSRKVP